MNWIIVLRFRIKPIDVTVDGTVTVVSVDGTELNIEFEIINSPFVRVKELREAVEENSPPPISNTEMINNIVIITKERVSDCWNHRFANNSNYNNNYSPNDVIVEGITTLPIAVDVNAFVPITTNPVPRFTSFWNEVQYWNAFWPINIVYLLLRHFTYYNR